MTWRRTPALNAPAKDTAVVGVAVDQELLREGGEWTCLGQKILPCVYGTLRGSHPVVLATQQVDSVNAVAPSMFPVVLFTHRDG